MDAFGRTIYWLLLASAGARTRIQIVALLRRSPMNAQKICESLQIHYTTVRHHLDVLSKNHLVEAGAGRYGRVYYLSTWVEARWDLVEQLQRQSGGD